MAMKPLKPDAPLQSETPDAVRTLPVFHGQGGLVVGLTGRDNQALRDAADAWPDRPADAVPRPGNGGGRH
jgi:hypothetical protein